MHGVGFKMNKTHMIRAPVVKISSLLCIRCGRSHRTEDRCLKLPGFPPEVGSALLADRGPPGCVQSFRGFLR